MAEAPGPDSDLRPCPACGAPLTDDGERCPRCNWTRRQVRLFRFEFWGSLVVFALLFALAFVAVTYMARMLESR